MSKAFALIVLGLSIITLIMVFIGLNYMGINIINLEDLLPFMPKGIDFQKTFPFSSDVMKYCLGYSGPAEIEPEEADVIIELENNLTYQRMITTQVICRGAWINDTGNYSQWGFIKQYCVNDNSCCNPPLDSLEFAQTMIKCISYTKAVNTSRVILLTDDLQDYTYSKIFRFSALEGLTELIKGRASVTDTGCLVFCEFIS